MKRDFRHVPAGYVATTADVEEELERIGHTDYVGMGRDATRYLLQRGVRLTGTDAWSWDAPFSFTARPRRGYGQGPPTGGPPPGGDWF
nr:cyclase family protein [Candidatus Mycolicibacterium alkanivorans]